MKKFLVIMLSVLALLGLALGVALYPKLSNLKAEYDTADAIAALKDHLREQQGEWPDSAAALDNRFPEGGVVFLDYSARSEDLLARPELLAEAIRPRSGKFLTYPYYERDVAELREVLENTNRSRQVKQIKIHLT